MAGTARAAAVGADRRRRARLNSPNNVLMFCDLGSGNGGLVLDLHAEGMSVQAIEELCPRTDINFELHIPGSEIKASGVAEVAWSNAKRVGLAARSGLQEVALHFLDERAPLELAPAVQPASGFTRSSAQPDNEDENGFLLPVNLEPALQVIVRTFAADGGAIACDVGNAITCRASVGMAPEVGACVSSDAGLAGECIRSGRVVYCADTETDLRVDASIARSMNLRSALVVPLVFRDERLGLLQLFSSSAARLCPADVLAAVERELAGIAVCREIERPIALSDCNVGVDEAGISSQKRIRDAIKLWRLGDFLPAFGRAKANHAALALSAVVVMLLCLGFYLKAAHSIMASTASQPATGRASSRVLPPMPANYEPPQSVSVGASESKHLDKSKSAKRFMPVSGNVSELPLDITNPVSTRPSATPEAAAVSDVDVPQDVVAPAGAASTDVFQSFSSFTSNPTLAAAVSTGVIEGKRISGSAPVYPAAAAGRLGQVVLQARIAENGRVKQVTVLSSDDPTFNQAASRAVASWRYTPFTLDGRPVAVDRQITIKFK